MGRRLAARSTSATRSTPTTCSPSRAGSRSRRPAGPRLPVLVGEKGTFWTKIRVHGTPGHGSQPFRTDNALVTAAEVVRRIAEYRPQTQIHESWRQFVEGMHFEPEITAALLDPDDFAGALAELPLGIARHWHACTHTTFAPTVAHGGTKTNVIPDQVELEVDIRTLPGQTRRRRDRAAARGARRPRRRGRHRVERRPGHRRRRSTRRCGTRWRAPARRLCEGSALGAVADGRRHRQPLLPARRRGRATASGCSRSGLPYEDFATMFHGNDERVDQESLALSTQLWEAVARDLVG